MNRAKWLWEQAASRAVYVVAFVQAVVALLVAFGLDWTADQMAAVSVVTSALLSMVFGQTVQRKPPTS